MQSSSHENTAVNDPQECVGGCGFYGSEATDGYCSVCFKRKRAAGPTPAAAPSQPPTPKKEGEGIATDDVATAPVVEPTAESAAESTTTTTLVNQPDKSRCYKCNKRVGLLGLKCRCGAVCCGTHLHAEEHNCQFDYRSMFQTQLETKNPKITSDKLPTRIQ